jgi:signal peptidase I
MLERREPKPKSVFKQAQKVTFVRPSLSRKTALQELAELFLLVLAVYCLANLLTVRFVVDGPSMNPTLAREQFLLVSPMNYILGQAERGDIMVFRLPQDQSRDFIKRVIGLPHEAVEIRDTLIYINGQRLDEPYLIENCEPEKCSDGFWQLGADEYFLLGDNRNQSYDSRSFGAIPRSLIVGEAVLRYWPLNEFAWIEKIGVE